MEITITKARRSDLPALLALQKLCFQSEAELVGNFNIPPLTQTLAGITDDYNAGIILAAMAGGQMIGSVRARMTEDTLYIGRLCVHPAHRRQGLGARLLFAIEEYCPAERCQLFTSAKSKANLALYTKAGYKATRTETALHGAPMVFLEKNNTPEK